MPVILAPLAGYSDIGFRRICRLMGAEYCSSEMVLDRSITHKRRKPLAALAIEDDDRPIAGQIIGNRPDEMTAAALKMQDLGFDVIDLNFACPVNKAIRRKRGGYFMSAPDQAIELVRAVASVIEVPLTVKLRKSFTNDEGTEKFYKIAHACRDLGVDAIAVHGRTVEQKYAGLSDWEFLAEARSVFPDWSIVGSGDIMQPQDALDMLDKTGVNGVLVARGGIGNPWFFRHVIDLVAGREPVKPDLKEQKRIIQQHFNEAVDLYGSRLASKHMRKFGIKYSHLHPEPKKMRMAFVASKNTEDWLRVLDENY